MREYGSQGRYTLNHTHKPIVSDKITTQNVQNEKKFNENKNATAASRTKRAGFHVIFIWDSKPFSKTY